MPAKNTNRYDFIDSDGNEFGHCYALTKREAKGLMEIKAKTDGIDFNECKVVKLNRAVAQGNSYRRYLTNKEKVTGIVNKTVTMHKDSEVMIKGVAHDDLVKRGLK